MIRFLDTNIITYFLKQYPSIVAAINRMEASGDSLRIPAIAYYETKRWLISINAQNKANVFKDMMQLFPIVQMTENTYDIGARVYVDLYREGKIIEDADILIAASAIEHGAVLLTNNAAHFARVRDLKFEKVY